MKQLLFGVFVSILLLIGACNQPTDKKPVAVFPATLAAAEDQVLAKGYVYYDENRNRKKEAYEAGVECVAVSNGQDIVQTDAAGYYEIPLDPDAILFIVKPAAWMTPVNQFQLPQFYHIHKPMGSPELKFEGVAPTGELPESIDFPLYPSDADTSFRMIVFGDTQPYSADQVDYVAEDIVHELINYEGARFGMTLGDIVGDTLPLLHHINDAISKIGLPWYYVIGNHDLNFDVESDIHSDETYERIYGPSYYAFQYGKVHVLVLDDVIYPKEQNADTYIGGIDEKQFKFLENYLKLVPKTDRIVLTMHIPFAYPSHHYFRHEDQTRLFKLLADFPNTLSLSAHSHIQQHMFFHADSTAWERQLPHHHYNVGTTSGSWWMGHKNEWDVPHTMMRDGTPNGYGFIDFDGVNYQIDWKVAGSPEDHQMSIHTPRRILINSDENLLLTVNVFNGNEKTRVSYRVLPSSEWIPMQRVFKKDPFYIKLDSLPRTAHSTHIWESELGTQWPEGRQVVEIQAIDMFGRKFLDHHTFRMVSTEADKH